MKYFFYLIILLIPNHSVLSSEINQIVNISQCKKTIYKEEYIQGDSLNPLHLKVWVEDIWLPCDQIKASDFKFNKDKNSQKKNIYKEKLVSLIGASIPINLAFGWAIPLIEIVGGGIGSTSY